MVKATTGVIKMEDGGNQLLINTVDAIDLRLMHSLYFRSNIPIEKKLLAYARNVGFRRIGHLTMVRDALRKDAVASGLIREGNDAFDQHGRMTAALLQKIKFECADLYKVPGDAEFHELLPGEPNEWADATFPARLSFGFRQTMRKPLRLYKAERGVTFVDTCGFQIYDFTSREVFYLREPVLL